jgi:UDP-N-acetylglucosamine acyltransferase
MIQQGINCVVGVNVIGMRRARMPAEQIQDVRRAYQVLYREGLPVPAALAKLAGEFSPAGAVGELLTFIRQSGRGINFGRERDRAA